MINNAMINSDNRLYLYTNEIGLVVTRDSIYVDNRSMNNRSLKVHKGVSNELVFVIRDRDRRLQNVFTDTLTAHFIHPVTRKRIFRRILENTLDLGKVKLVVTAADIESVEPGLYLVYLSKTSDDVFEFPLYADQDNNMQFNVEITDQASAHAVDTQVQNDFLQVTSVALGDTVDSFMSGVLKGNLERNFANAQHTMAFKLAEFTGTIQIQASCYQALPANDVNNNAWFIVDTLTVDEVVPTVAKTFVVNCNWVRVLVTPITGNVVQVLLRN